MGFNSGFKVLSLKSAVKTDTTETAAASVRTTANVK